MRLAGDDVVGEEHDGDAVVRAESAADRFCRRAGDLDTIPFLHRAGCVEHQRHIERRVIDELWRLGGDADEMQIIVQGVFEDIGGDGEAVIDLRQVVVVVERVDPFLGSYRSGLNGVSGFDPVEGEEVRGAVDVEGERGSVIVDGFAPADGWVILEVGRSRHRAAGALACFPRALFLLAGSGPGAVGRRLLLLLLLHRLLLLLGLLVLDGGLLSLLLRRLLLVLDFFLLLHCFLLRLLLVLLLFGLRHGLLNAGWLLALSLLRLVAAGDGQHRADCNGQHDQRWGKDA